MFSDNDLGIYSVNGNDHGSHSDSPTPQQKPAPANQPIKPKEEKPPKGKK